MPTLHRSKELDSPSENSANLKQETLVETDVSPLSNLSVHDLAQEEYLICWLC